MIDRPPPEQSSELVSILGCIWRIKNYESRFLLIQSVHGGGVMQSSAEEAA
ncbi:hypothetical protein P3T65_15320 [Pseudomonas nitroreducens]|uniref:hypothetical protein n=1 Tax=Pseudomonas nitroreducens TaxID=46680 RepID=UPI0023F72EE9|nr:hypothetical protein [Pseudomonas nitroreducens]WEW95627.1 hypothetical protein P3T65_15320 [Pseudomonas nitroreducens]